MYFHNISDNRGKHIKHFMRNSLPSFSVKEVFTTVNNKGTLRGLHFQYPTCRKILQCLNGSFNVRIVVKQEDLKYMNEKYTKVVQLNDRVIVHYDNYNNTCSSLFVPSMAALGYVSLEDNSIMNCLSSELFDSSKDVGFNYKSFKIDWNYPEEDFILNEKDKVLPKYEDGFAIFNVSQEQDKANIFIFCNKENFNLVSRNIKTGLPVYTINGKEYKLGREIALTNKDKFLNIEYPITDGYFTVSGINIKFEDNTIKIEST